MLDSMQGGGHWGEIQRSEAGCRPLTVMQRWEKDWISIPSSFLLVPELDCVRMYFKIKLDSAPRPANIF